ncbi:hypothetical protein ACFWXH_22030 [Mesorhizobium sp. NPDC059054]|uniref:hypothetical protein n=1 Tax=Mesorhizobium sp. NPDC059054 TaxID=3346711 RepID=UPI0036CDB028
MSNVAVTGVGLLARGRTTESAAEILSKEFQHHESFLGNAIPVEEYRKNVVRLVAREDRSILNDAAIQCLLTAIDAFALAEEKGPIDGKTRENIGVFTSAEREREFPTELWDLVHRREWDQPPTVSAVLSRIGQLRERVHPLALFKKLPTNALYHISKYFQLRGGGYPIQRMSLGGICMIEEAAAKIADGCLDGAILSACGNMASLDNHLAFSRMGLLRERDGTSGILPSAAAASILLEPQQRVQDRGASPFALLHRASTKFHDKVQVNDADWLAFYDRYFSDLASKPIFVVCYDNGIEESGEKERSAVRKFFANPKILSYKKYTGYTGQPNNLVDFILTIADTSVPIGASIILNGIGTSVGMGAVLFEKCRDTIASQAVRGASYGN